MGGEVRPAEVYAEAQRRALYPVGAICLVSGDRVIKRYECDRHFGRIQYQGRWYVSARLHAPTNAGVQIIYREEEPA